MSIVPVTLGNESNFPQEYYKGYPGIVRIKYKPMKPNQRTKML